MPDRIPTTPEQWAAIEPNETDRELVVSWMVAGAYKSDGELLAAASRIAEHERTKDVHAYRLAGYLSTLPGNTDKHPEEMLPEARRILEDR